MRFIKMCNRTVVAVLLLCGGFVTTKNVPNNGGKHGAIARRECLEFPTVAGGSNHIFGGIEAALEDFPYMAALGSDADGDGKLTFYCGASLISNNFLLTAAHCVTKDVKTTIARFGVVKLINYNINDPPVDVRIQKSIVHPESNLHDIALLQLERSIDEDFIYPICLYTDQKDPKPDLDLTIAGWGQTDSNYDYSTHPLILLKGQVNAWPLENCSAIVESFRKKKFRKVQSLESKLCALKVNAIGHTLVDACSGDSGGPLELELNSRRYLVGIASSGLQCGTNGVPGFYTRVYSYIDWIEANVWPNN